MYVYELREKLISQRIDWQVTDADNHHQGM